MKKGKTTYALLAAEEEKEKGRNSFEDGVYAVFILMTTLAIWQFAVVARPDVALFRHSSYPRLWAGARQLLNVGKALPKALGASVHHRVHKVHFAAGSRPG